MADVIVGADEQAAERIINLLIYLHGNHNFSATSYPARISEVGSLGATGEDMVRKLINLVRDFDMILDRNRINNLITSIIEIRAAYRPYISSSAFRQAARLHAQNWCLQEAEQSALIQAGAIWLIQSVYLLMDLLLSPVGVPESKRKLIIKNQTKPLWAAGEKSSIRRDENLQSFHQLLPHFEGLFDYVDDLTARQIFDFLPETFVAPNWYLQQQTETLHIDNVNAGELYSMICTGYPVLQQEHYYAVHNKLIKEVRVREFEGNTVTQMPFRCLSARVGYNGTRGEDMYIALSSPYYVTGLMLVGNETLGGLVSLAVRKIYEAVMVAIRKETNIVGSIDDLLLELGVQ